MIDISHIEDAQIEDTLLSLRYLIENKLQYDVIPEFIKNRDEASAGVYTKYPDYDSENFLCIEIMVRMRRNDPNDDLVRRDSIITASI